MKKIVLMAIMVIAATTLSGCGAMNKRILNSAEIDNVLIAKKDDGNLMIYTRGLETRKSGFQLNRDSSAILDIKNKIIRSGDESDSRAWVFDDQRAVFLEAIVSNPVEWSEYYRHYKIDRAGGQRALENADKFREAAAAFFSKFPKEEDKFIDKGSDLSLRGLERGLLCALADIHSREGASHLPQMCAWKPLQLVKQPSAENDISWFKNISIVSEDILKLTTTPRDFYYDKGAVWAMSDLPVSIKGSRQPTGTGSYTTPGVSFLYDRKQGIVTRENGAAILLNPEAKALWAKYPNLSEGECKKLLEVLKGKEHKYDYREKEDLALMQGIVEAMNTTSTGSEDPTVWFSFDKSSAVMEIMAKFTKLAEPGYGPVGYRLKGTAEDIMEGLHNPLLQKEIIRSMQSGGK